MSSRPLSAVEFETQAYVCAAELEAVLGDLQQLIGGTPVQLYRTLLTSQVHDAVERAMSELRRLAEEAHNASDRWPSTSNQP